MATNKVSKESQKKIRQLGLNKAIVLLQKMATGKEDLPNRPRT